MITAKEAMALVDATGVEVTNFLEREVEPVIRRAAEMGKREALIYQDSAPEFTHVQMTAFQTRVIERLQELGFKAVFARYGDTYVPRGLADDDGSGPMHRNVGFRIGW